MYNVMENSFSCFVNRLIEVPLYAGQGFSYSGWDVMQIIPWMALPLLLVLFAGLYFMSLTRRKHPHLHS